MTTNGITGLVINRAIIESKSIQAKAFFRLVDVRMVAGRSYAYAFDMTALTWPDSMSWQPDGYFAGASSLSNTPSFVQDTFDDPIQVEPPFKYPVPPPPKGLEASFTLKAALQELIWIPFNRADLVGLLRVKN